MKEIIISRLDENQRIDKYVRKYLSDAPLSFIYKLFRKKDVKINGHWVKENYIVKAGETLTIYVTDEQLKEFVKEKEVNKKPLSFPIVYEDENILIVNKPRGILVHGDNKEKRLTLSNEVLNYLYYKGEFDPKINNGFTPAPAHRLDRNTSGLVLFGKNLKSLQQLEEMFKEKKDIEKHYYALVKGKVDGILEIDAPLKKDPNSGLVKVASLKEGGLEAKSIVKPVKLYKAFSLVDVNLVTGRTHQIRVHLSYEGFPIIGDSKYGDFSLNKEFKNKYGFENQFLHAYSIKFKKIEGILSYLSNKNFTSELPLNMKKVLEELN